MKYLTTGHNPSLLLLVVQRVNRVKYDSAVLR